MRIEVKRAYDRPAPADGSRVLVDRVWPRGIVRKDLRIDDWLRALAPSAELRKWFGHDPAKWNDFKSRYFRELDKQADAVDRLLVKYRAGTLTLLFGAKDIDHNNAVALKEYLDRRAEGRAGS